MKNGYGMCEAQKKPSTSVKGFKTIPQTKCQTKNFIRHSKSKVFSLDSNL